MRTPLDLRSLLAEPLDARFRAFPVTRGGRSGAGAPALRLADVPSQDWNLFTSGFFFPVLALKASALDHNVALFARFCAAHGVSHAPHGKTTLAPQIFERQLAAGAFALTAASAGHVRVYRAFGVPRILLANELVVPAEIRWVRDELSADPTFDFYCFADSLEGVRALSRELAGATRPLKVLVELGLEGGRAGTRALEDAVALGREIARAPGLELAGVGGFEGIAGADREPGSIASVDRFCERLVAAARELLAMTAAPASPRGAAPPEFLVTAGGSAFPDRVVEKLSPVSASDPRARVVLRSGCYVTHDDGAYRRLSPFTSGPPSQRLRPALELWAAVLSRPEPGRAILGFGKRDAPFDAGLPEPRSIRERSGARRDASGVTVVRLDDQHAYVALPPGDPLAPGDLVGLGVSHPCLAFDKWSLLPLVDDDYDVVDAVRTYF